MVTVPEPAEARAAKQRPSQRAKALLDALGLLDDVVVLPEPEPPLGSASDEEEPARPTSRRPRRSPEPSATSAGPYQLPSLDLLRTAPTSTNDGSARGRR